MVLNPTITLILAYSLLITAILLFTWSLAWDHLMRRLNRRPQRRCPKCWYNLTHTPSQTCSECGYSAPSEKQLHKSKKPKRGIALAILLFLAAQITFIYPRYQKRGPIGAIPNWTLIALLPTVENALRTPKSALDKNSEGRTWQFNLLIELEERTVRNELDFLDWHLLIRQCFIGDSQRQPCSRDWQDTYGLLLMWAQIYERVSPKTIAEFSVQHASITLRVPNRWPADLPVPIYYTSNMWSDLYNIEVDWMDDFHPSIKRSDPDPEIAPFPVDPTGWGEYFPPYLPKPKFNRFPFWYEDKIGNITFTAIIKNPPDTKQIKISRRIPTMLHAPEPTEWSEIISPFQSDELDTFIKNKVIVVTKRMGPKAPDKHYCWVQIDFSALHSYLVVPEILQIFYYSSTKSQNGSLEFASYYCHMA